jgi:hypothetical protein
LALLAWLLALRLTLTLTPTLTLFLSLSLTTAAWLLPRLPATAIGAALALSARPVRLVRSGDRKRQRKSEDSRSRTNNRLLGHGLGFPCNGAPPAGEERPRPGWREYVRPGYALSVR